MKKRVYEHELLRLQMSTCPTGQDWSLFCRGQRHQHRGAVVCVAYEISPRFNAGAWAAAGTPTHSRVVLRPALQRTRTDVLRWVR